MSTILTPGQRIRTVAGRSLRIAEWLGTGGQADVYATSDESLVFKHMRSKESMPRVRHLMSRAIPVDLPATIPIDTVDGLPGYLMRRAAGRPVAELIDDPGLSYGGGLRIAHAMFASLAAIHEHFAHGDGREENLFVSISRLAGEEEIESVTYIDVDNYQAEGAPEALCIGDPALMAPELRNSRDPRFVSRAADVYAATQIAHKLLLRRDDAVNATCPAEFDALMGRGGWRNDPLGAAVQDGLSSAMLDSHLASLIRAALSADAGLRPTAREFALHLQDLLAQGRVFHCPACQWPVYAQGGTKNCPHLHCGKALPEPILVLRDGRRFSLASPLVFGSSHIADAQVARNHARLCRAGPLVMIRDLGTEHGTWARDQGRHEWHRLAPHRDVVLAPERSGNQIRFGSAEAALRF